MKEKWQIIFFMIKKGVNAWRSQWGQLVWFNEKKKQTKKFYSKIQREDGYCMTTDGSEKSIFLIGVSTSELP